MVEVVMIVVVMEGGSGGGGDASSWRSYDVILYEDSLVVATEGDSSALHFLDLGSGVWKKPIPLGFSGVPQAAVYALQSQDDAILIGGFAIRAEDMFTSLARYDVSQDTLLSVFSQDDFGIVEAVGHVNGQTLVAGHSNFGTGLPVYRLDTASSLHPIGDTFDGVVRGMFLHGDKLYAHGLVTVNSCGGVSKPTVLTTLSNAPPCATTPLHLEEDDARDVISSEITIYPNPVQDKVFF